MSGGLSDARGTGAVNVDAMNMDTGTGGVAVAWHDTYLQVWVHDRNNAVIAQHSCAIGPSPAQSQVVAACAQVGITPEHVMPILVSGLPPDQDGPSPIVHTVPTAPLSSLTRIDDQGSAMRLHAVAAIDQKSPLGRLQGPQTALAGLIAIDPAFDGVVCLPAPRTVWARISAGEIVSFQCFMTLGLASLLIQSATLADAVRGTEIEQTAFATALDGVLSRPQTFAAGLHQIGAARRWADATPAQGRGRLMGLLLGLELAGAKPYWLGQRIAVIGTPADTAVYASALKTQGAAAETHDIDAMMLEGLRTAFAALPTP